MIEKGAGAGSGIGETASCHTEATTCSLVARAGRLAPIGTLLRTLRGPPTAHARDRHADALPSRTRAPPLGRRGPAPGLHRLRRLQALHLRAPLLQTPLRRVAGGVRGRARGVRRRPGRGRPGRAPLPHPAGRLLARRARAVRGHRHGAQHGLPRHRGRQPAPEGRLPGRGLRPQGALSRRPARTPAPALRALPDAPLRRGLDHPRRRLRVPDRQIRGRRRQKGRRVLHAQRGRPRDGGNPAAGERADGLRPHVRLGRDAARNRPLHGAPRRPRRALAQALRPGEKPQHVGHLQDVALPARHRRRLYRARRHAARPEAPGRRPGAAALRPGAREPAV